jgi:hypothetical protein
LRVKAIIKEKTITIRKLLGTLHQVFFMLLLLQASRDSQCVAQHAQRLKVSGSPFKPSVNNSQLLHPWPAAIFMTNA